jgi:outer membrane protein insertion porin family
MLTRTAQGLGKGVYVADVFQEDLAAILALYRSRGFLEAQVTEKVDIDPQTASVDIVLHIAEGVQTLVDTVSVEGQAPRDTQALKQELQLTPGTPYTPIKLQEDENALAARISPLGYPHVQASGTGQLSADSTRADIVYALDPGPSVDVGQVFFVGNLKTRTTFMRREFSLTAGEPFVLSKILEAQRDLRNLDIFDSVQVHTIGLKEKDSTVDMVIRLVEKRPYYFVAGAGYQTDKGFYGRTQIGDHNFTGTAKDLWLKGELSQVGYRAEAGVSDPRWLGTSISAHASAFSERSEPFNQDFGTDILGARLSFSRRWKQRLTTGLGVRFESREQYLRGVSASTVLTEPGDLDPRAVFVVIPTVLYDSRDSFIRPVKGLYTSAAVEISNGLDNALDDFLKYRFELRGYHALSSRVTLAGRVWVGYLAPYGGADPALDQLFFLGGTNTVRGFKENMLRFDAAGDSVGGRLAIAGGLEARIALGKNIELTPFVDTGSVQQSLIDAGSDAFRWSTGLGLQYITPIGPIGLFYGHKLDRRSGESAGQWHLSVGYTF